MELADVLSTVAILASAATFWWTLRLEKRLRRQADQREMYDAWIVGPVQSSFQGLNACLGRLTAAAREHAANTQNRANAIRTVQQADFEPWFFDFDALCESKSDAVMAELRDHSVTLADGVFDQINLLSGDLDNDAQVSDAVRELARLKQRFMSNTEASMRAARLALM